MLRTYLQLALRTLHRHRIYSVVNILGLAIGIAFALLVVLFLKDELTYDDNGPKSNLTYRLIWDHAGSAPGSSSVTMPLTMVSRLQSWLPGVERATALKPLVNVYVTDGQRVFNERRFFLSDSSIFEMFNLDLVQGTVQEVISAPNTVAISRSTARRYFGEGNAIGKTLKVVGFHEFQITAVYEDMLWRSHFHADFIGSFSTVGPLKDPWAFQGYV